MGTVNYVRKGEGRVSLWNRRNLSPRELECAKLVGQGLSNGAIAKRMFITPKSVENTLNHIYRKMEFTPKKRSQRVMLSLWINAQEKEN